MKQRQRDHRLAELGHHRPGLPADTRARPQQQSQPGRRCWGDRWRGASGL